MQSVAIALLGVVIALAGCSSSGSNKSAANDSPTSTTPSTTPAVATGAPIPSPGCGTSKVGALDADHRTIQVDGQTREYLLTTPAAHGSKPVPLVLDFHGLAEGAEVHTHMSNFGALAQKDGFVVAFPNGQGQPVRWNLDVAPQPHPDMDFVDQLLDKLGKDLCLDTSRVYASGLSYGAFMTSRVACEFPNKFAAVAPVAGVSVFKGCATRPPIPVIAFHGTADPILGFNGGVGYIPGFTPAPPAGVTTTTVAAKLNGPGYPANVAAWAKRNRCDPKPTDTKVAADVIHRVYSCPAGQDVEFYIVIGGGHAWPGSAFSQQIASAVGHTTMNIDATKLMWKFFQRFQVHDAASATNNGS